MTVTGQDIHELADKIRYDLTAAQAKLTDLRNMIGALNLPDHHDTFACPKCGIGFRSTHRVDEHLYIVHNGPPPSDDDPTLDVSKASSSTHQGNPAGTKPTSSASPNKSSTSGAHEPDTTGPARSTRTSNRSSSSPSSAQPTASTPPSTRTGHEASAPTCSTSDGSELAGSSRVPSSATHPPQTNRSSR